MNIANTTKLEYIKNNLTKGLEEGKVSYKSYKDPEYLNFIEKVKVKFGVNPEPKVIDAFIWSVDDNEYTIAFDNRIIDAMDDMNVLYNEIVKPTIAKFKMTRLRNINK